MAFSLLVHLRVMYAVLALAVGMALFVPAPAQAATKQDSAVEAVDPIAAATVNLYCNFRYNNKRIVTSGSGVVIGEQGVVLTNAHVAQYFLLPHKDGRFKGSCAVRTGSPAKKQYSATVLYIPPAWLNGSPTSTTGTGENDFALLYITDAQGTVFPTLPLSFITPAVDEEVQITGYPSGKLSYNTIRSRLKVEEAASTVTALRNFKASKTVDVLTIAPSKANAPGVSGGPVTNQRGEVVGMATAVSSGDNPSLRALTLSYINRTIQAESYLPLPFFLISNLEARATQTSTAVSTTMLKALESHLLTAK